MAYVVIRAGRSRDESNQSRLLREREAAETLADEWRHEGFEVTLVDTEACSVEEVPAGREQRSKLARWSDARRIRRGSGIRARSA
jgi:hypothetical protein